MLYKKKFNSNYASLTIKKKKKKISNLKILYWKLIASIV